MRQFIDNQLDGWFYKKNGTTNGPVAAVTLQELLASGQIAPRQAVWMIAKHGLLFVTATTASQADRPPR
jgi:GYF domain 2